MVELLQGHPCMKFIMTILIQAESFCLRNILQNDNNIRTFWKTVESHARLCNGHRTDGVTIRSVNLLLAQSSPSTGRGVGADSTVIHWTASVLDTVESHPRYDQWGPPSSSIANNYFPPNGPTPPTCCSPFI